MSGEILSKALGDISDELLNSAMRIQEKKRRRTSLIASVIAAGFLLLPLLGTVWKQAEKRPIRTAPGVITVLAHGLDEKGNLTENAEILEEGELFLPQSRQEAGSCQTFPFTFQVDESLYPGMELKLQLYTTDGIFYKNDDSVQDSEDLPEVLRLFLRYYGQEYETEVGRDVYWQTDGFDYLFMAEQIEKGNYDYGTAYRREDFEKGPAYIHVILRADGYIVGFCAIKISLVDDAVADADRQFRFEVLSSVSYPQVDGAWQTVTQEDVRKHILDSIRPGAQHTVPTQAND